MMNIQRVTQQMANPVEFAKQVKSEIKKVTWPSRKETVAGTIAVFVMVFFASLFMYFADQVMALLVKFILGLGA